MLGPGDSEHLAPFWSESPSPLHVQVYEIVRFLSSCRCFELGFVLCSPNSGSPEWSSGHSLMGGGKEGGQGPGLLGMGEKEGRIWAW